MGSLSDPAVKAEPQDDNQYSPYVVQDDEQAQEASSNIKTEPIDDDDSLFIPQAPAPLPANYVPMTLSDLAYRPAPSSRPVLTSQELPGVATNMPPPPSTIHNSLPALPSDFHHPQMNTHSRLPDSDGKEAPTLCFESGLRRNGFQHRLICGHLVATDIRVPCGTKCGLERRSETKPANKSTIECPHPNCVKVRKSMRIVLRSRQKPKVSMSKKPGVRVVPEGQHGHHVNFSGLELQEIKDGHDEREQAPRAIKRIRLMPRSQHIPTINAADEAAERLLKDRLSKTSRQERELRKLQVDGTDTLKFKQPAGWQMNHDLEMEKLRQRRQLTQTLSGDMYSMPEDHHDQLIKGVPGLIVDREQEDAVANILARAHPSEGLYANEDEIEATDLVEASFAQIEKNIHCLCKQPQDYSMLQCGTCTKYFHAHCIGKGLSTPARFDLDPEMSNNRDAEYWRAQDQEFSCRKCDVKNMIAQQMLGSQKRKKPAQDIDSGHQRPDLRAGKMAKLKECKTDVEKARVQKVYNLLYSNEAKLSWEDDFMCANCDAHISGTRYHCSACILFDLCESCMRKGKEHPCSANSKAFRVFYLAAKDIEMTGTEHNMEDGDHTIHGRPMRQAAMRAMGGMTELTHPHTVAEARRRSLFQ